MLALAEIVGVLILGIALGIGGSRLLLRLLRPERGDVQLKQSKQKEKPRGKR